MSPEKTTNHIFERFKLDRERKAMPYVIPHVGRYTLAYMFNDLNFKVGVEVGVELGGYAKWMCEHNPQLHLYGVDAWAAYAGYREHVSQNKLDGFYEQTVKRLEGLNCTLIRKFSMDAVKDFKNNSLDFVFIDGNHSFVHCAQDIHWWQFKVRPGGIVAGHDYRRFTRPNFMHVVQVVNGYTDAYGITPWFVLCGSDPSDSVSKTWFWVKHEHSFPFARS